MIWVFADGDIDGLDMRRLKTSRSKKVSNGNFRWIPERRNISDARNSLRLDY